MKSFSWDDFKSKIGFLAKPWFQGAVAVIGVIWVMLPSDTANEIKASRRAEECRELRQVTTPVREFLRDFLLDPHMENLGWNFHNQLVKYLGSESPIRERIKTALPLTISLCHPQFDLSNQINVQVAIGGSTGKILPARQVTEDPKLGGASSDIAQAEKQHEELDCFLDRANYFAGVVDGSGGFFRAVDLEVNGGKILRDKTTDLLEPYVCKESVPDAFCDAFQDYTNYFIAGAMDILRAISKSEESCEKN